VTVAASPGASGLGEVAVLASGGLDSAVLVADLARAARVHPVYVEQGLRWEAQEKRALEKFLGALGDARIAKLTVLRAPAAELYGPTHWSLSGRGVPDAASEDAAVFLPGRNVLLLGLAAVWASVRGIHRVAIGSLGGNPFPDGTPEFFRDFAAVLSRGLGHEIVVEAPYRGMHKKDLLRAHAALPLELTLTCIAPRETGAHCGACNKCEERRRAFREAAVEDRTVYAR
jgi:7-cyano-7-deazaguanine synthase